MVGELLGLSVSDAPQNYRFGETTFRGYSALLRTLNVKLGLLRTSGV